MRMPLTVCLLVYCATTAAQTDSMPIQQAVISIHDLNHLGNEYDHLSTSVQKSSLHLLASLQGSEAKLRRQLAAKDSVAAAGLFSGSTAAYRQLEAQVNRIPSALPLHPLKDYLPGVDSVQTALRFLQGHPLPAGLANSVQVTQDKLLQLQNQLQQANNITAFVQQRQQQLQSQLQAYGMSSKVVGFEQKAWYYKDQAQQYKALLHDPDRLASRLMNIVRGLPAFQLFWLKNSYLATLFRLPGSGGEAAGAPLPGLQTRDQVNAAITARLGPGTNLATMATSGDNNNSNPAGGSMIDAQSQFNVLKDKAGQYGSGSSDADMPSFRPNLQHNKTFLQRIQLGFDMQTQSSTNLVPALSTWGLSAGYLLNPRSIIGIGAAYKLGWGQPFSHIAFSGQGASLRSFVDWRLKGSLWLAGGFEANYLNAFTQISQLRSLSAWQQSGLIGLMKTYKAGKRSGNMQLLYDFLHATHLPPSQPVIFRVGYSLN